jgi:hypothetical protein
LDKLTLVLAQKGQNGRGLQYLVWSAFRIL